MQMEPGRPIFTKCTGGKKHSGARERDENGGNCRSSEYSVKRAINGFRIYIYIYTYTRIGPN